MSRRDFAERAGLSAFGAAKLRAKLRMTPVDPLYVRNYLAGAFAREEDIDGRGIDDGRADARTYAVRLTHPETLAMLRGNWPELAFRRAMDAEKVRVAVAASAALEGLS